jgi:hypothetical protein
MDNLLEKTIMHSTSIMAVRGQSNFCLSVTIQTLMLENRTAPQNNIYTVVTTKQSHVLNIHNLILKLY